MLRPSTIGPVVALLLVGCATAPTADRLAYAPPVARGALPEVLLPGTSASENLATAVVRLQAAGFTSVRSDVRGAMVTGRSSDPGHVDCGTFIQTALGTTATFPASAPRSVLFAPGVPGGIVTREMQVTTVVEVALQGTGRASVTTRHDVRASQSPVLPGQAWRDRAVFSGDGTGSVADGVTCTGSSAILERLARP